MIIPESYHNSFSISICYFVLPGYTIIANECKKVPEMRKSLFFLTNHIDATNNFISVTLEITKLESGFSAVRYDGDYGFDLFLEQGGADSDQTVLRIRKQYV